MIFKATPEQVAQIAVNAVKASRPMGMGHMHYRHDHTFDPKDFMPKDYGIDLDYVCGRMVKLRIKDRKDGTWETRESPPEFDYQSWCRKYMSYEELAKSVPGIEILP